ncbi:cell division protein PerM [Gordonia hydrophobica]|uniref:DUF6350 family protein n=1 Tax=Gordonia hydrophobica TaxID=40516 RepID=A0ABZ2U5I9_9ACTN|nr:DUF6350 family protein [Gordonia hydrophobica]MBM7367428.1 hypothetical protein [Gordonia hydrophobica]
MSAPTSESLATRLRQVRLARRADQAPRLPATWDVIKVGLTVPTFAWLAAVALVLITKVAAGAGFSGLGSATAAGWLAMNQTTLTIGGVVIGVLPLVPTILIGYGTYRVVRRATVDADSFNELLRVAGTAIVGPVLATALALAIVADGASSVSPVGNPNPLAAFGMTILVHGVSAAVGLVHRVLPPFLDEFAIPASDRIGARGGAAAFGALITGGAVAVFVGFVVHFNAVGDVIAQGNTVDGYLGLTVLSVLYLPNFVVGGAAVASGASATLGSSVIDALSTHPGVLPPVPVAAVVPTSDLGAQGALLFAVPAVAGILLGWYTRSADLVAHLRAIGVGAAVASLLMVVAAGVSGGTLGELGEAGVGVPVAGVFTFTAVGVTAVVTAGIQWLVGYLRDRGGRSDGSDFDELFDDEDAADVGSAGGDDVAELTETADDSPDDEADADDEPDWDDEARVPQTRVEGDAEIADGDATADDAPRSAAEVDPA